MIKRYVEFASMKTVYIEKISRIHLEDTIQSSKYPGVYRICHTVNRHKFIKVVYKFDRKNGRSATTANNV